MEIPITTRVERVLLLRASMPAIRLTAVLMGLIMVSACDPSGSRAEEAADPAPVGGKADGVGSESVRPPRVTLVDNSVAFGGRPGPARSAPALRPVSDGALLGALDDLAQDVDFADYPFSGCHDRAHVTYRHLAGSLGSDAVAKVWVFGPALMTVALDGGLTAPVDPQRWGVSTTLWDYHVAAVVSHDGQMLVVDPVLSSIDEPMTLDEWFSSITTPPGSVYTILDGELYSFNTAGPSDFSGGRLPLNGGMFEYVGFARQNRWLEANLARDAVGEALADDPFSCPQLSVALTDPQFLVDSLSFMSTRFDNTSGCQPFVDLFVQRREEWTGLMNSI